MDEDHNIVVQFEAAVHAALDAGWTEERIKEEVAHALETAMDPD